MEIRTKTMEWKIPKFTGEEIEFIQKMYEYLWTHMNGVPEKKIIHHMVSWSIQYSGFAEALMIINLLGHSEFEAIAKTYEYKQRLMMSLREYSEKGPESDKENAMEMFHTLHNIWDDVMI